ncbi:MAG: HAD-IIIA family hydrolase [Candidatus Omnitrophica bacterium]|nr:HAD-IIIA family hydrolase [Candidatus Omnitrophota bacterium]
MPAVYSKKIIKKARLIKVLALDVDGVMTDAGMIYDEGGEKVKRFNVNDGLGIFLLKEAGLKVVIVTAKLSGIVRRRAQDLKVDAVYENFHDKIAAFSDIKKKFKVRDEEICFIGDDVIDIPVLMRAGLSVSPGNALDYVKDEAHLVTEKTGGNGAVREVCDLILRANGSWKKVTARYYSKK